MKITWYGAAAILLEERDSRIIFDPLFWENITTPIDVCITHGHMDHLAKVPELLEKFSDAMVYCTKIPCATLRKIGVNQEQIHEITPNSKIHIGELLVNVYKGKHIHFDAKLIVDTIFEGRIFKQWERFKQLSREHFLFPEGGETVIYEIQGEKKNVLLLGSLGLEDKVFYPKQADALILPFQGNSNLVDLGLKVVEQLKPKMVILDHFDDAFPPISQEVDTNEFEKVMKDMYPKIKVIKPIKGKSISI